MRHPQMSILCLDVQRMIGHLDGSKVTLTQTMQTYSFVFMYACEARKIHHDRTTTFCRSDSRMKILSINDLHFESMHPIYE